MNINLHIERLVLDGLPVGHGQGALIKAAVEAELGRLLREGGLSQALRLGGAFASQRANSISMGGDDSPAQVGQQIGRAVYSRIGGGSEITRK
jgi:hypothetical protein